jgi:hypothetical protein
VEISKRSIDDDLEAENSKRSIHQDNGLEDEINKPDNSRTNLFVKWRSSRQINAKAEDEESGNLYKPKSCSICLEPYREGDDICLSQNEKYAHVYHLDCIVDSPKSCSICLEPYREGDDICWSQNEKCAHVYHLDCIVDWLMNSNECPLCRADYLKEEGSCELLWV